MSKAFTKETEAEDELPDEPDLLPAGVKNYVTPRGLQRLQDELRQLARVERPKLVETASGRLATGIARRTAITFMASAGCAKSIAASVSSPSE